MVNVVFTHYSSLFNTIWYHATILGIKAHFENRPLVLTMYVKIL